MRHTYTPSDAKSSAFLSRRNFLQFSASAGFLGGLGSMGALGRALAQDANVGPNLVRLSPDIESIVRVIEDTPRGRPNGAGWKLQRPPSFPS